MNGTETAWYRRVHGRRDPIAIVGAGCRLPEAPNVRTFWNLLVEGRDAIKAIPAERFGTDTWFDPALGRRGQIKSRYGGFLDDIDKFDADFFGISAREAVRLDPKTRLLMETTWDALEDAGIPAKRLAGSQTGVYTSSLPSGYWDLLRAVGIDDLYAILGAGPWEVPAGRISYQLDLRGPSMGVEATCATSLLAVHLACLALWSGEIDLAIVGGVNLLITPDQYSALFAAEILSPTGRCRFGDAQADGYVRSEAVVTMVLKPLARALDDGDRVYAAILGSAATNDGRSGGTQVAPGIAGQEAMLRGAYRDAGISPGEIDYVEAHGPGTPVGDRTELTALDRVLREGRDAGHPCLVGSVKSNIGHAEVAAGLTGLLKTALAVHHRTIPATLHVNEPNPILTEPGVPLELARGTRPWPERGRRAMAGVSSFGISGTNVHVVLAEPPPPTRTARPDHRPAAYLLPLSARDSGALAALAEDYANVLSAHPRPIEPLDACYSAGGRRTHHDRRLAVVGADADALVDGLRSVGSSADSPSVVGGQGATDSPPRVVFVFPGQGPQWMGIGRELLAVSPAFARRMSECSRAVEAELGWSPMHRLEKAHPLSTLREVQPALWAVQVALGEVWRDWGIEPDLVIGHSMGEISAAVTAGALTVREAAAVVCHRSLLLERLRGTGAMWAVRLDERTAQEAIDEFAGQVCVGVINSDHFCVLSGDRAALTAVIEPLRRRGIFCRPVHLEYASHAPLVEPLRPDLLAALAGLNPRPSGIPIYSTARDRIVDGAELDPEYWAENLRRPVRFASAIQSTLSDRRPTMFVEISPHPVLLSAVEDGIDACAAEAVVVPSLQRDHPERESLLRGLGTAYVRGCEPNWRRVYRDGRFVPLPGYPWRRERFWVDLPDGYGEFWPSEWINPASTDPVQEPGDTAGMADAAQPTPAGDHGVPVGEATHLTIQSVPALVRYVVDRASEVLAVSPEEIDPDAPLIRSGLDSLLAARLRVRIKRELDLHIPVRDLLGTRTPAELAADLCGR